MQRYLHYIDGAFAEPRGGEWFDTQDPFTGETWAQVARGGVEDIDAAVEAAHRAVTQGPWATCSASERGALLHRIGDLIARDAERLALLESRNNGKTLKEMRAHLNYIPKSFYYYGGLADKVEGAVIPLDRSDYFNFTEYEPLGVVALITPWNSPLTILAWKLAPALAAGNAVVIKPSEFTSVSALELTRLCEEAGAPPGLVNVVTGFGQEVGTALVTHPKVAKVSFTGSDATGRRIYAAAAAQMKHVTMELGGKSPNIIFDDADLDDAANGALAGIFLSAGQSCVAGSRLLVQESIHDEMVERLAAKAKAVRLGDPRDPATHVGPIATPPQFRKVLDYLEVARAEGAVAVTGGGRSERPECGKGWFVEPTIFKDVDSSMRIAREEVFGPVLSILRFKDEAEAIAIANDTIYGLAAAVWTRDMPRAIRMARKLEAGTVWVNGYRPSSYLSPFGGYKQSGLGRENGIEAIRHYLQLKSVWLNIGARTPDPFA